MTEAVRIAEGVQLFVLDESGVFFSGERQELYAFNTTSTYVWCCIEEQLSPPQIVDHYAASFDRPKEEAGREVAALLHDWQGRGWISNVDGLEAPPIHFNTALARLLTNASLRDEFARSRDEVAERMGLSPAHRKALAELDPEEITIQARVIEGKRTLQRERIPELQQERPASAEERCDSWYCRAFYRLLGTNFELRYETIAQWKVIHPLVTHLRQRASSDTDVVLEMIERPSGHLLLRDGTVVGESLALNELAPIVKSAFQGVAINRTTYFMEVHAAVLGVGGRCLLLPAAPGSGKSTLSAALVDAGFEYYSDEVAVLERDDLAARPVPLPLAVKPGAIDVLTRYFPEVPELAAHDREDGQMVRYLVPFVEGAEVPERSLPVGWIVFPRYLPDQPTSLQPTPRAEALQRVMAECLLLPELLDEGSVQSLVRWIREIPCFDLSIADASDAVELLRTLTS